MGDDAIYRVLDGFQFFPDLSKSCHIIGALFFEDTPTLAHFFKTFNKPRDFFLRGRQRFFQFRRRLGDRRSGRCRSIGCGCDVSAYFGGQAGNLNRLFAIWTLHHKARSTLINGQTLTAMRTIEHDVVRCNGGT